jgi:hypothetical protein
MPREPADRAERGVDEQGIQGAGLISGLLRGHCDGHGADSSSGTTISRLRIFPVGPLGRAAMNHTRRGYQYAATCALTKAHSSSAHARLERNRGADLLTQLGVPHTDHSRLGRPGAHRAPPPSRVDTRYSHHG